jgi:hypothetical protein
LNPPANYKKIFARYKSERKAELCGMQFADEMRPAYALHLIRNLRNHVAHGIFPIIPNPDYMWGKGGDAENLLQLLNHSCRLGAIYIQMLIKRFNEGFIGYHYLTAVNAHGPEFEYFIGHCNADYIGKLHVRGDFSLTQAFDYSSKPWT